MRAFGVGVEPGRGGLDADLTDAAVERVSTEAGVGTRRRCRSGVTSTGNWQCRFVVTPSIGAPELRVDLRPMARALLVVALRALGAAQLALVGPQSAEAQPVAGPAHPREGDLDVVVALEVYRDRGGAEVAVLVQTHDPLDHLAGGDGRAEMRPRAAARSPSGPSSSNRFFHLQDTVRLIPT